MADNSQKVMLNTHTFLTVPQELDEDSWISGEELFTEGSSDDETKNLTSSFSSESCNKKSKNTINNRRRISLPKFNNLEDEDEDSDDAGAAVKLSTGCNRRSVEPLEWRPKRGSLKFSDLLTTPDEGSIDELNSEDLEFLQRPLINVMEYLGESERTEKIQSIRLNIQDLDKRFTETENILQNERKERLENQRLSSLSLEDYAGNDEFLFENVNSATIHEEEQGEKSKLNRASTSEENNVFIKRNIELAAKAMTKLPFTDEEKEKLEQILLETAPEDEEQSEKIVSLVELEEKTCVNNGYQVSEVERTRIAEINAKLQEFNENTEEASTSSLSNIDGISFWDNLVLDQALKNVNAKLAELESKNKQNDD